jgi:hypothetical protein
MVCRNICERLYSKIIVGKSPYEGGERYCRRCEVYFYQVQRFCRCCGMTLKTSPAGKKRYGDAFSRKVSHKEIARV